jgi:hypothetical protein
MIHLPMCMTQQCSGLLPAQGPSTALTEAEVINRVIILARKNGGIEGRVAVETWIAKSFDPKLLEPIKVNQGRNSARWLSGGYPTSEQDVTMTPDPFIFAWKTV